MIPIGGERSKNGTLNRVGLAPASGHGFCRRTSHHMTNARSESAMPTPLAEREVERWIWPERLKIRPPADRGAWTKAATMGTAARPSTSVTL
jgi:hypothetical protein